MAHVPRLYWAPPLRADALVPLDSATARRLGQVLRRRAGDPVHLFNERDGEYAGVLQTSKRDVWQVQLGPPHRQAAPEPGPWLLFGLLKRQATDWLVEKATELGVARLQPVLTDYTQGDHVNGDRLHSIALGAAEQCERLSLPEIAAPQPVRAALAACPPAWPVFAALERDSGVRPAPCLPAVILIGPEGGWSPAEQAWLRAQAGILPLSLGPRVLRAETAALAALAWLQLGG